MIAVVIFEVGVSGSSTHVSAIILIHIQSAICGSASNSKIFIAGRAFGKSSSILLGQSLELTN